jgi:short subunit fatty acids transporter
MFSWVTFIILVVFCIVSSMVIALVVPSQGLDVSSDEDNEINERSQKKRKSDFPEFDGKDGRNVLIDIQAKYPRYTPEIVPKGSAVTMDYQRWRVRIYVSKNKKVIGSYIG